MAGVKLALILPRLFLPPTATDVSCGEGETQRNLDDSLYEMSWIHIQLGASWDKPGPRFLSEAVALLEPACKRVN